MSEPSEIQSNGQPTPDREPSTRRGLTAWIPPALHWGVTLAPLVIAGLLAATAPWIFAALTLVASVYGLVLLEPWRRRPVDRAAPVRKRVAVVGAGPSGLVAVKEFKAAGHEVTCFEAGDSIGGVFSRCYDSTRLTSSAVITAFSDFPPAPGVHRHWTKHEYLEYLERYVDHFGLRDRIQLGRRLVRATHDEARGGWKLALAGGEAAGVEELGGFDTLVVCSGLNGSPNLPDLDDEGFTGEVLHAKHYRNATPFAGKRVVIVGLGETGADVVAEVAEVAASCVLSLRRGAFVTPRVKKRSGYPVDYNTNRLRYALPKWAHSLATTIRERAHVRWGPATVADRGRQALLGLPGTAPPFYQFVTKSDEFVEAIDRGRCRVAPAIVGLTRAGVRLEGGEEVPTDVVLYATGYTFTSFDFLPADATPSCPSKLWLTMYSPAQRERLVLLGFARPAIGAIPPVAELQARYAAQIANGTRALPSLAQMQRDIEAHRRAHTASFDRQRLATLVDWVPYMDALADQIGCRPRLRALLWRPRLLWKVVTGPMLGAQYRLNGPGATPELAARSLEIPGGMPLRDKLWFMAIHALLAAGAIWEALPSRRRFRSNSLV